MKNFFSNALDFINFDNIMEVLIVIILILVCLLVASGHKYLKVKCYEMEAMVKLKALEHDTAHTEGLQERMDPFYYRMDSGEKILKLIQTMVSDEIVHLLFTHQSINAKYNLIRLNEDGERIAKTVYEGINKNIITSQNSFFTPEYVMHLITQVTMITLVNSVRDYNKEIRLKEVESAEEE